MFFSKDDLKDNKIPTTSITVPGVPRKERQGTKLSRPITTTINTGAASSAESDSGMPGRAAASKRSAEGEDEEERIERRLKKCYTDDTYGKKVDGILFFSYI